MNTSLASLNHDQLFSLLSAMLTMMQGDCGEYFEVKTLLGMALEACAKQGELIDYVTQLQGANHD
jgi:hypothetical protein